MSKISETEIKSMTKEQNYMRGYEDGKSDVLDKIRAEIAVLDDADYDYEGYYKAVTDAVEIIDKYKAESEDEDVEYQRQIEQLEHDILYEPTFNPEDGSM